MTPSPRGHIGTCETCGKRCYTSKRDAKAAIRQRQHRAGRLSAYRCGPYWHIGHLHRAVAAGQLRRDQIRTRKDRRR